MPHLLAADDDEAASSRAQSAERARNEVSEHRSVWGRLNFNKIGSWLKPDEGHAAKGQDEGNKENGQPRASSEHAPGARGLLNRRSSRRVVPGLPRPLTFKRMNSEKRERLLEVPLEPELRRAASADRRPSPTAMRDMSSPPMVPSVSAPDLISDIEEKKMPEPGPTIGGQPDSNIPAGARQVDYGVEDSLDYMSAGHPPPLEAQDAFSDHGSFRSGSEIDDIRLQEELEAKWILNLSMHFRDNSDREKFFLTFAEMPAKWRRVTVSIDYRQLEPDSLEADLKSLHYQRDKSARIYEAIRDSLPDIQFYDTVTNLKLQTTDGRLHVHVTEDVNEIIPYPSTSAIEHLDCKRFRENAVCFDSHISGFVYKISVNNRAYIKKEIPGPDAVEEFLYEINALCNLQDSKSVIKFEGIIVDETNQIIKGLLISYAEQGALIDMIYDFKPTGQLYWERREKWAWQIVEGLSEIHEAGYVQGDFTLSNIVIDKNDDAKIIDINRRGCPVGWEPPELAKLIESGQRISIYIGVKSDLYQLGMVLWALAEQQDEPERQDRPLTRTMDRHRPDVPDYFRDVVRSCLSDLPRHRLSASQLLAKFPPPAQLEAAKPVVASRESVSTHRSDKEYIDPATAVDLNDISQHRRHSRNQSSFEEILVPVTEYPASSGSYIVQHNNHRDVYPAHRSVMSLDDSELENELASLPASRETRWEQVYVDGDTKLVQRGVGGGGAGEIGFAGQDVKEVMITTPPGEMEMAGSFSKSAEEGMALSFSALGEIEPEDGKEEGLGLVAEREGKSLDVRNTLDVRKSLDAGNGLDPRIGMDPRRSLDARNFPDARASFIDRVHQLAQSQDTETNRTVTRLADLEHEVDLSTEVSFGGSPCPSAVPEAPPISTRLPESSRLAEADPLSRFEIFDIPSRTHRTETGFSIATGHRFPMHQDSGFAELDEVRKSLDESIRELREERVWDGEENTVGVGPKDVLKEEVVEGKEIEQRDSTVTIRERERGESIGALEVEVEEGRGWMAMTAPQTTGTEDAKNKGVRHQESDTADPERGIPIPTPAVKGAEPSTSLPPPHNISTSAPSPTNDISAYLSYPINFAQPEHKHRHPITSLPTNTPSFPTNSLLITDPNATLDSKPSDATLVPDTTHRSEASTSPEYKAFVERFRTRERELHEYEAFEIEFDDEDGGEGK